MLLQLLITLHLCSRMPSRLYQIAFLLNFILSHFIKIRFFWINNYGNVGNKLLVAAEPAAIMVPWTMSKAFSSNPKNVLYTAREVLLSSRVNWASEGCVDITSHFQKNGMLYKTSMLTSVYFVKIFCQLHDSQAHCCCSGAQCEDSNRKLLTR